MTIKLTLTAAALATALASSQAYAAPVVNGSFEDRTSFVPNGDNTMSLDGGSTAMTGWTVIGDSIAWIGTPNPFGLGPSNGDFFLDLTGYPVGAPFGGVQQTLATVAGRQYEVTFDLGSHLGSGIASVDVSAAGASQTFSSSNPNAPVVWESQTFRFTASAGATVLSLLGSGGTDYIGLDNVAVADLGAGVPEPATWAMLIAGFGLVGAATRRRSPAAVTCA
jgi:hypothetical protein